MRDGSKPIRAADPGSVSVGGARSHPLRDSLKSGALLSMARNRQLSAMKPMTTRSNHGLKTTRIAHARAG